MLQANSPHLRTMLIYLIGFMGCGKSTHGKSLARFLNFGFIDMDDALQHISSKPISELFSEPEGEAGFRRLESVWLETEAVKLKNTVIAAGGGAPCYHENMDKMNQTGITVYLRLHPVSLFHRLLPGKAKRPLISRLNDSELMDFIESKLSERESYYMKAHLIVKGENLDTRTLAREIISHPLFSNQK